MEIISHDIVIIGAGLAGLRAAIEASKISDGKIDIAIVSKLNFMCSHSVCAEGGTAAVLNQEEGDTLELHAWDTVKGSDFLSDQDVVSRFVQSSPKELLLLEHWGLPWTRKSEGRIDQRAFGGHSFDRATYASDKTGFFEMRTLYDRLLNSERITRYEEWFVTSLVIDN